REAQIESLPIQGTDRMHRKASVELPGSRDASRFVGVAVATASWCGIAFFSDAAPSVAIATAYVLPVPLAGLAILAAVCSPRGGRLRMLNCWKGALLFRLAARCSTCRVRSWRTRI